MLPEEYAFEIRSLPGRLASTLLTTGQHGACQVGWQSFSFGFSAALGTRLLLYISVLMWGAVYDALRDLHALELAPESASETTLPPSRDITRFWWVNQNQTFAQETAGGYLWSPKRGKNSAQDVKRPRARVQNP